MLTFSSRRRFRLGLLPVPANHRSLRRGDDDPVDAQLGELLDDELRSVALHRHERTEIRLFGRGPSPAAPVGDQAGRPVEGAVGPSRRPQSGPGAPIPRAQSQRPGEVAERAVTEAGPAGSPRSSTRIWGRGVRRSGHAGSTRPSAALEDGLDLGDQTLSPGPRGPPPRSSVLAEQPPASPSLSLVGVSTSTTTSRSPRLLFLLRCGTPALQAKLAPPLGAPGYDEVPPSRRVSRAGSLTPSAAWANPTGSA